MAKKVEQPHGGAVNRFEKGESGNKAGRPRKLVTSMGIEGYSSSQVNDAIQILLAMKEDELTGVEKNKDATILEKTVAKTLLKDMRGGHMESLGSLMDRVFGKAKQDIGVEVSGSVLHAHILPLEIDKNLMMQLVIGRVAARRRVPVAEIQKMLTDSYYANTIDAEATVIEDKPLPSTLNYSPEKMAEEIEGARAKQAMSVEDRLKEELAEKLRGLKAMQKPQESAGGNNTGLLGAILKSK